MAASQGPGVSYGCFSGARSSIWLLLRGQEFHLAASQVAGAGWLAAGWLAGWLALGAWLAGWPQGAQELREHAQEVNSPVPRGSRKHLTT